MFFCVYRSQNPLLKQLWKHPCWRLQVAQPWFFRCSNGSVRLPVQCERKILKLLYTFFRVILLSGMISHKPGQGSNQSSKESSTTLSMKVKRMGISCHFEPSKTPSLGVSVGHWPFRKCHKERSTRSQLGILREIPLNQLIDGKKLLFEQMWILNDRMLQYLHVSIEVYWGLIINQNLAILVRPLPYCQPDGVPYLLGPRPGGEKLWKTFDEKNLLWFRLDFSSSWWFQPLWKICSSKWESSQNRGENKKYLKPPPSHPLCPLKKGVFSAESLSCSAPDQCSSVEERQSCQCLDEHWWKTIWEECQETAKFQSTLCFGELSQQWKSILIFGSNSLMWVFFGRVCNISAAFCFIVVCCVSKFPIPKWSSNGCRSC